MKLFTIETIIIPVPIMKTINIFVAKSDRDWFPKFFRNVNVKFDSRELCSGWVFLLKTDILMRTIMWRTKLTAMLPITTIFTLEEAFGWLWGSSPEHKKKFIGWRPKIIKKGIIKLSNYERGCKRDILVFRKCGHQNSTSNSLDFFLLFTAHI